MRNQMMLSLRWLGAGWTMVVVLAGAHPATAIEFRRGQEVVIKAGETVDDDVYAAGETVTVSGTVTGDLVASGRVITIDGTVEGDLIACGQAVIINGQVGDDVLIAGMALKLGSGASIDDDLLAAGFSFESEPDSHIGGSAVTTGFQSLIGGSVEENLDASVVGLTIMSEIGGDVVAEVESAAGPAWWTRFMPSPVPIPTVAAGLTVEEGAQIGGKLEYTSGAAGVIADKSVVAGEVIHQVPEVEEKTGPSFVKRIRGSVRWLMMLLAVGLLLVWLVPEKVQGVADRLVKKPLASLGVGLITLVAFPIMMMLVLGLAVAAAMILSLMPPLQWLAALVAVTGCLTVLAMGLKLWVALILFAPVVVALVVGHSLLSRTGKAGSRVLGLAVGLLVLAVLLTLPYLGFLTNCLMALLGLGAGTLWSIGYWRPRKRT